VRCTRHLRPTQASSPGVADVLAEAERLAAGLEGSELVAAGETARMRALLARPGDAIHSARLPTRPLHGDAHAGNVLRTPNGPLWTDFEDTCSGPVEWDLACLAAGAGPRVEALAAYGRRADDPLLAPFVEARAAQVAVWTAFMAKHHPQLRERLASASTRCSASTPTAQGWERSAGSPPASNDRRLQIRRAE
jgi:Ser/Thr protein kinase RdoA (MazF antagonist)